MRRRLIRRSSSSMMRKHIDQEVDEVKKNLKMVLKVFGKLLLVGLIGFAATFTLYITNGENKLIYYVIRPFLNKHYDSQVRDRKI